MNTWRKFRNWVKVAILVLIAALIGLGFAVAFQSQSTTEVKVYELKSPSDIPDFIEATEKSL